MGKSSHDDGPSAAVGNVVVQDERESRPVAGSSGARTVVVAAVVFAAVAVAALTWAKWWPYAGKIAHALTTRSFEGTSALTGGARLPPAPSWHAAWSFTATYFRSVWPALVAALLIAAAIEALVPRGWLARQFARGPRRLGGSAAGGLVSLPSMMCTCCTAPITSTLRRRGAPPASALAYWIGNPTLNPAVLVFLAVALPWQWFGVRVVGGVLLVFGVTALVARLEDGRSVRSPEFERAPAEESLSPSAAVRRFGTALGRMLLILVPEYAVVVLLVGAVRGWLFPLETGPVPLAVVLFALAGSLFVVPTAGEIPIIHGLLALGIGAAPVGALLITLPALSLPSLLMVGRSFSPRTLVAVFAAVVALGVASGTVLVTL
ncbi:hypothetical protein FHX42_003784 [Saccharopolyspora lacisalsi]|uniref:Permease n=1 Tax=Halosaccharopolyspora lacisalsi TaxID=1000566 RepID=A0A839E689_9PSEU|nr:permease [Halosaccharopolyspora lacisalsi]MBA8826408.1 hypothetical protein [Halosaccharopolyspora lacisalsi]